ncbi:MAG: hypothetical protein HBSIN02_11520 [Bacteroidia bacterium]|nr:MAG: hypothetical protein HBSIN02_11520 [Bacteroidia bacterium]
MKLRFDILVAAALLSLTVFDILPAQEGGWTVSAGAGYALISFSAIKEDMVRDVRIYNENGYEIPPFPSPSPAPAFGAKASYRFDRDYSVSVSFHHDERTVATSWTHPERMLSLERSLGATVIAAGLAYHFPTGLSHDLYAEVEIGMILTRATSSAYRTQTEKLSDSSLTTITVVHDDTRGVYRKSKLTAIAALGGVLPLFGPLVFRWEALYRLGQVGIITGRITTFGQTNDQDSSVPFDYSGIMVLASIGVQFY